MLIFKAEDLIPVIEEARKNKSKICLGKDHGVYIFSRKCERNEEKQPIRIAYAQGCNPKVDEFDDWWELSRAELGGDDFGMDFIAHNRIFSHILEYKYDLTLKANGNYLTLGCKAPATSG